jgi:hypothetical protein
VLEKYIDVLIASIQRIRHDASGHGSTSSAGDDNSEQVLARAIIEALTLKCPNCRTALDPNPDGCCAMQCMAPGCGKYFCWLCFRYEELSDSQQV